MQVVMFTKLFEGRQAEEVGPICADLGVDGIDLLIRPGFTVDPEAVADALPKAVRALGSSGLTVPMATTDLVDAGDPRAARVLGACADAGIGDVRLGYWTYDASVRYADVLARARAQLDGLEELARSLGVRVLVQLHGGTIHASGIMTRALLEGRDPAYVGSYPDPGNQVVQDGREDWRLTLDAVAEWLVCLGVKNGGWFPGTVADDGQRGWHSDWTGIADGMVPWTAILRHLRRTGFDGLLSLHSHYHMPFDQALDQTRTDVRFVRRAWAGAGEAA